MTDAERYSVMCGQVIEAIIEWSKTLPDEHRASLIRLCRDFPSPPCFCGCHVSSTMAPAPSKVLPSISLNDPRHPDFGLNRCGDETSL